MATLAKTQPVDIQIKNEWCKGCGICLAMCPKKVLAMTEDGKAYAKNPENCISCNKCEIYCPDFAIFLGGRNNEAKKRNEVNARQ